MLTPFFSKTEALNPLNSKTWRLRSRQIIENNRPGGIGEGVLNSNLCALCDLSDGLGGAGLQACIEFFMPAALAAEVKIFPLLESNSIG